MTILRSMTNQDLLAYKRLCSVCYTYPDTGVPEELPEDKLSFRRGVFNENGQLLSAMMQIPYQVRFCGQTVRLAGIGGVVTDPAARSQGHVRRIFEEDLPRLYREGYVFSALYPFSYRFYGKFGYTWAEFWQNVEISRSDLRKDLCLAQEILRILPEEDDQGMRAIYQEYIADKHLAVIRDEEMWNSLRKGAPWETLKHAYVIRIGGKACAYWIGSMQKQDGATTLRILDMAWTSRQGMEAVFAMFRGMNEVDTIALRMQGGFDVRVLVDEAYDVRAKGYGTAMVRVVNAARALAMLEAPVLPGTVTLEVRDEQIGDNCGNFTVTGDGYLLTVEKSDSEKADLRCSIQGLTALVMGRQNLQDAIGSADVELLSSKSLRFAKMLFAEKKLHMNQGF